MKGRFVLFFTFVLIIISFILFGSSKNFFSANSAYATVTTQNVLTGAYTSIQDCVFGTDADTTCTLNFHLKQSITNTPDVVYLTPMANSSGSIKSGAVFSPFVNSIGAGIVTINKLTTAGSGGNRIRVTIQQLHSIIK